MYSDARIKYGTFGTRQSACALPMNDWTRTPATDWTEDIS